MNGNIGISHTQFVDSLGNPLDELKLPTRPVQDLAIIGGGIAGLSVAKQGIEHLRASQQTNSSSAAIESQAIGPLQQMSLLVGGDSLAFSPAQGEFADLLTLFGAERCPRAHALETFRALVEAEFRQYNLHFERTTRATKVTCNPSGTFRVLTSCGGQTSYFDSRKIVLALGHSLRDIPAEIRSHVIRGAGELCAKLAQERPHASSKEECLGRLLSRYKLYRGEVLRIGLVGLGASTIEVVKVLERFLAKPSRPGEQYRIRESQTPIELIFYDPRISSGETVLDSFYKLAEECINNLSAESRTKDVYEFWGDSAQRLMRFVRSRQALAVPNRLDWSKVQVVDGFIVPSTIGLSDSEPLSVLIDCAPFVEGIGGEQYEVLKDLDVVRFQSLTPTLWKAARDDAKCKGRLAFAGAAVIPRSHWSTSTMEAQAKQIISEFYGSASADRLGD